jgi:HD-GYP domain-containing protein (c-di-GMP phosphodiesterase class II)
VREDQKLQDIIAEAEDSMYRNKLLEGNSLRNSIISSLEQSLHEKTHETREHARRMQDISVAFALVLDLPFNEVERLILLAKLHDIGKIGIPDHLLIKPAELNPEEWEIVKKHPEIGFRITQSSHDLTSISQEVLSHHERWDRTGYPRRLLGEEIPYLARIINIVDSCHDRGTTLPRTQEPSGSNH